MKGLLVKDLRLFGNQKKFFFILFFMVGIFILAGMNSSFIIGYGTLICTMFTLSTISYDEYNNGNAFLFTMPFTRNSYVIEKYVFGLLAGGGVWTILTLATGIMTMTKSPQTDMLNWLVSALAFLIMALLTLFLMIPLNLKFGSEKSRIAMFAVVFGFIAIIGALNWLAEKAEFDVTQLIITIVDMNVYTITAIVVAFIVFVTAASILISLKVMKKKQF